MKTNIEFMNYCEKIVGSLYLYGTFGQRYSKNLYYQKKKQYPNYYTWNYNPKDNGKLCFDCIGVLKAFLWTSSFGGTPKYNPSQDVSANGMRGKSKNLTTIKNKKIPEVRGLLLFKNGHIGYYNGNGIVIEAKGHSYGVIKSKFDSTWKWYGYCPWLEYVKEKPKNIENNSEKKYFKKCKNTEISIVDALKHPRGQNQVQMG